MTESPVDQLSSYIAGSAARHLPPEVVEKTKHHILDTLGAALSGSRLKPGILAIRYATTQGPLPEAQVIGSSLALSAVDAAFANGIMAHADETDDMHEGSVNHPGCAIVPAALAVAQREGSDGGAFVKAVALGYDIGCRMTRALGVKELWQRSSSICSIGAGFGAASAAAFLARLDAPAVNYVLSYAAQQTSGLSYMLAEEEHVEKAFVFGGMPARNGVTAAMLVKSGFTGVSDPFRGEHNFLQAFSSAPDTGLLLENLGNRYEVMSASLKRFPVGGPIQAAVQGLISLVREHGLTPERVASIVATLPVDAARIVDDRSMPDVNLQHILAVTLLDGTVTFGSAHSRERMEDPLVKEVKKRITLRGDPGLSTERVRRPAVVDVVTREGSSLSKHVEVVPGMVEHPLSREEVEEKFMDLAAPVVGADRGREIVAAVWKVELIGNMRHFMALLSAP